TGDGIGAWRLVRYYPHGVWIGWPGAYGPAHGPPDRLAGIPTGGTHGTQTPAARGGGPRDGARRTAAPRTGQRAAAVPRTARRRGPVGSARAGRIGATAQTAPAPARARTRAVAGGPESRNAGRLRAGAHADCARRHGVDRA